jgi:hypothetical protein
MGALISRQGKFNCSIYFMIFDLNLVLTICFTLEDIFFMYNVILINFRIFAVLYREANFVLKKIDQVHIYTMCTFEFTPIICLAVVVNVMIFSSAISSNISLF